MPIPAIEAAALRDLMRGVSAEMPGAPAQPLRVGEVVAGKVTLMPDGQRGIMLGGVAIKATVPGDVPLGEPLKLQVTESSGNRLVLHIVKNDQTLAKQFPGQTPAAPPPAPSAQTAKSSPGAAAGVPTPPAPPAAAQAPATQAQAAAGQAASPQAAPGQAAAPQATPGQPAAAPATPELPGAARGMNPLDARAAAAAGGVAPDGHVADGKAAAGATAAAATAASAAATAATAPATTAPLQPAVVDPALLTQTPWAAIPMPGGAQARMWLDPDGKGDGADDGRGGRDRARTMVVRYESPTMGRVDVVLRLEPEKLETSVLAQAGHPIAQVRAAVPQLREALAAATGRTIALATGGRAVDPVSVNA